LPGVVTRSLWKPAAFRPGGTSFPPPGCGDGDLCMSLGQVAGDYAYF
jgi:hypothetical protein